MSDWEVVNERAGSEITERMSVTGGWIYRTQIIPYAESSPVAVAMTFVPDASAMALALNNVTRRAPIFVKVMT